ncbi:hypothetical protein EC957_004640 [Mortierella hygrophila]|uniref:Uncharacterized protein n=1 Tax=Mortierella hygrophila TaxID=979708 RepID=A0A9P6K050_9FUNG|nr:hypothetical protein EC957_004640 [Mortierella hygrophila]
MPTTSATSMQKIHPLGRFDSLMDDDDDELSIMLDTVSEKKKLSPATDLSDVFRESAPRNIINIIVQCSQN